MLLINRRPWVRGLSDEGISQGLNSEEFPSKPVFNQQIHKAGDASEKKRRAVVANVVKTGLYYSL